MTGKNLVFLPVMAAVVLVQLFTAASGSAYYLTQLTMAAYYSLLIIGLSFNMLGMTKIKVMNYVPAVFFPILLCTFM